MLVRKNVGNDVSKDSPVPNVPHMLYNLNKFVVERLFA